MMSKRLTCRPGVLLAGFLLVAAPSASGADMVTLIADRDNTLFEDAGGALSNGSGPVFFTGNNGQDLARRALLRFDVAGAVPAGALVTAATLRLNCSNASTTTPRVLTLHRVFADWGEGASSTTSGAGAAATSGDATWIHRSFTGSLWAAAGGDFAATASASQSVGDVGAYTWTGADLAADARAWLADPGANWGWLLLGDETALNTARRFDSREHATAANRPALTLEFTSGVLDATPAGSPSRPGLEGVFPSPGRGPVSVAFVLPAAARARLVVVDLAGRPFATLADDRFAPGTHTLRWDGRDRHGTMVPPGIYFARLLVEGRDVGSRRIVRLD